MKILELFGCRKSNIKRNRSISSDDAIARDVVAYQSRGNICAQFDWFKTSNDIEVERQSIIASKKKY